MATLTETAYYTRKIINFSALGLIILILTKSIFSAGIKFWRTRRPPKTPPPAAAFGKLPQIEFPESKLAEKELVYRLETTTGGTPNLGDRAKVYFMPVKKSSLLALERAKTLARKMGFYAEPQKISDTVYQWRRDEPLVATLEMDIINSHFTIKKNWRENQSLLMEKVLPIKEQAITEAKSFLQAAGLLTEELNMGEGKIAYLRFVPPNLVPAISLSEADLVRVNLYRKNLDDLPFLPANPKTSLVSLLFSGSRKREMRILEVNYTHFPLDRETFSDYPLKSSAQAWEELKAGQGFIANLGVVEKEVVIRNISLAYYESNTPQNYLQPIYVFKGDIDFVAYVPAIRSDYLE